MTIKLGPTRDTDTGSFTYRRGEQGTEEEIGGSSAQTKILTSTMIGVN